jgi:hypothetical protein
MPSDPLAAELAFAEARAALRRVQAMKRALALPVTLVGSLYLAAAPVVLLVGRDHLSRLFGPCFAVVLVIAALLYRRSARLRGVRLATWPWAVILIPMLFFSAVASHAGITSHRPLLTVAGPFAVNAAAFAVVAVWLRWRTLGYAVALMAVCTAIVSAVAAGDAAVAVQTLVYGGLLLLVSRFPSS